MSSQGTPRAESRILLAVFVAALAVHVWGVTFNWKMPFLAGHEFRQSQTAITTYYIDQQNNFSLLYETPILGKPWVSILMEVPVYEWAVVGLSRLTGLPHYLAARTITLTCFYLTLPAAYLLLGRLGLAWPRRLLILALVLACPVYIFYSRAFLMDSMAFMCSAWFLLGFVRTMDQRSWSWLGLTVVAGTGASLIKSAVLGAWLIPAAAYGAWLLWREIRAGQGWRGPVQVVLWGAATVAVPLGALRAWVVYTDPLKAVHDSAWIFTSENLTQGNWGLFNFKALVSGDAWHWLMGCWDLAIMSRWLILVLLVMGLAFRSSRRAVLGLAGVFFLAQAMFPYAYAYQDYYFYACAVFLNAACGFALVGLLDSRVPRWVCAGIFALPFAGQVVAYRQGYLVEQKIYAEGGYPYTNAIRDLTPKDSVIIVAGADWAAMVPYYSQRRALMVRNGLEWDEAYLHRAFDHLAGEEVSAVVLVDKLRENRRFKELVAQHFDIDLSVPAMTWGKVEVYVPRLYHKGIQLRIKSSLRYPDLVLPKSEADNLPTTGRLPISPAVGRNAFFAIKPAPYEAEFQFGLNWIERGPSAVLSAHPKSDLWLRPPAGATKISWSYGIFPGAYEKPRDHTDGVEFIVEAEKPDGQSRRIYYRLLDPWAKPEDRGDQHVVIPYAPEPDEVLRFSTRPNQNLSYDWAYWVGIQVK